MTRGFALVDVFGSGAFTGNGLAVVADDGTLDTASMLAMTRWFNQSETTFLLPPTDPGADYRVRIFTLERELPFAGHPTLGTCRAWLAAGGTPRDPSRVVQQCGAGLIPIRIEGDTLAFAAPPLLRQGPVERALREEILGVLGATSEDVVDMEWADNGPGWVAVLLRSAEAVLALRPTRAHARRIDIGVVGPHAPGADAAFELRAFFSDQHGALLEDPVTGSLNASVAQWLLGSGRATAPYVAAQGTALGRRGRVHITRDASGQVWVGGRAEVLVAGRMG